jgi:hypothetical protein
MTIIEVTKPKKTANAVSSGVGFADQGLRRWIRIGPLVQAFGSGGRIKRQCVKTQRRPTTGANAQASKSGRK